MERDNPNLSTRYQPRGSARNLDDRLDRDTARPAGDKPDSMTAAIDSEGKPKPPPGGPR